ncbi:hypothetical protein SprV_0401432100 [Sparganum proliferum]
MGGKGHEEATNYQAEVGQAIKAEEDDKVWEKPMDRCAPILDWINTRSAATENDRWRGTDELRFDEVLMTHLVDPSGGPTAPGASVRMFVFLVSAAGGEGYD